MVIEANKYYPKQMNGPVISAFGGEVNNEFQNAEAIEKYLYNLSIETAQETELENIGKIIGYPRPLVPVGFEQENVFIFTTIPMEQSLELGFSAINTEIGGRLTGTDSNKTNYMSLGLYRKFLEKVAYIKRYGLTLYSIDKIAGLVDDDYTISWDEYNNIEITYNNPIGFMNLWILSNLFYKFESIPTVNIITASEENI